MPARTPLRWPSCHVTLRERIPPPRDYPSRPRTVEEHTRKARMDRGLHQRDAAWEVGVNADPVRNREAGRTEPDVRRWPGVIRFLGYVPFPRPISLGERVLAWRKLTGTTQEEFARAIGVDPSTVARWEAGSHPPGARIRRGIEGVTRPVLGSAFWS